MTPPGPLDPDVTLVDIRPQELRWAEPIERWLPNPVVVSSLDRIEKGQHGLSGRVVVVCEFGTRSRLAAMYLQADGLEATSLHGGVLALKRGARP